MTAYQKEVIKKPNNTTFKTTQPQCRKMIISPKNKSKVLGFCEDPCFHITEINDEKRCTCCYQIVTNRQNYTAMKARFSEFYQDNEPLIEFFKSCPSQPENRFFTWMKIGIYSYTIDIKYFVLFQDLATVPDPDKYDKFFEHIKSKCPRMII